MTPRRAEHDERVLILAPSGRDGPLSGRILSEAGFSAQACPDMEALCDELERGAGALLLAQEALGPAAFRRLSEALERQPAWSDIPTAILLGAGELTRGRAPMLQPRETLRNATYLERPVRIMTLVSTLRAALAARRRQYELREQLAERERTAAELQRVNEQLRENDRRKDQFLALLGHELRNPLATISNGVRLLAPGPVPPEKAARIIEIIDRQTHVLVRLVDDLLDVSRVTAGKIELKRQPIELNQLAERCRQAVSTAAREQGHALQLRPAPAPLWVDGDAVRLEQVVVNLLTNAVKYTPRGGRIDLVVEDAGGQGLLRVRDNGMGIAAEMLPRVFDLFSQAPRTLERAQGGLGIGLTLVRSLVELHGGSVAAESPGVGQGSEFIVRLPLREARAEAPAPPPASPHGAPRHIVLIEDNPDLSEVLEDILLGFGHKVQTACNGSEGVALVLAERPEVALVDIGLPGIDGYEVARQIRAVIGGGILLVAMTGYGQPEDRRLSKEAGFDAHLTKPPEIEDLMHILAGS